MSDEVQAMHAHEADAEVEELAPDVGELVSDTPTLGELEVGLETQTVAELEVETVTTTIGELESGVEIQTLGAIDVGADAAANETPAESIDLAIDSIPVDSDFKTPTSRSQTPTIRARTPPTRSRPPTSSSALPSHRSAATTRSRIPTARSEEQPSPFESWQATESQSPYKTGEFVLLLLDEFCRHYRLHATVDSLYEELQQVGVAVGSTELWCELQAQCRSLLSTSKHSHPLTKGGSTLEKLVDFCVHPPAQKAVFAKTVAAAHSPMHVTTAAAVSPSKRTNSYSLMTAFTQLRSPITRPSQRPSGTVVAESPTIRHQPTDDQQNQPSDVSTNSSCQPNQLLVSSKKKKKKKAKPHRSNSVVSLCSSPQQHGSINPAALAGTYGEPALVEAHRVDLQRDLTATRLLEKELRGVRLEVISATPSKVSIQKRLGFHTLTAEEAARRQQQQDPYASELVLEKYGFAKRQDCALCQYAFLPFNLPHKVSFRCVMDVYDAWGYVPADRDTVAKYRPPLCYDAVLVCRMCAQIVFQHAKQPVTSDSKSHRPLSRKHRKAKSLASLATTNSADDDANSWCSDPYALPPLLGDDVADHRDYYYANNMASNARRMAVDGDARLSVSESPAKAIYALQMAAPPQLLSAKEWDVINPDKSSTRHSLESSVLALNAPPPPASHHR